MHFRFRCYRNPQYRAADISLDGRGMILRRSPPPVKGRTGIVVQVP